jgi:D-glycero-alpha-D-manno-heptose 1-phosphate guanylyltransferase
LGTSVNIKPPDTLHEDIPAVLLVGGLGTRLQSVLPGTPKPLARVGDTPFLQLLIRQLRSQGFRRVVMCTGHLAEQVEEEFGDGQKWGITIEYSKELRPLGTAGAVKFAERFLFHGSEFLVMNGDSFLEADLTQLIHFHRENNGLITMAVHRVPDAARYGTVQIEGNRVLAFLEKSKTQISGLVNGGVYVFNRSVLNHISDGPSSLEEDVFPRLLGHKLYAIEQHGMFIDIGTPEDYARAQTLCQTFSQATLSQSQ